MGYVGFSVAFAFAIAALSRASRTRVHPFCPPVDAGGVGVPDALPEHPCSARRGPTTSWAGAAGGSGTRRTPPLCRGWRAPAALAGGHPNSAPASRRGRAAVHLRLLAVPAGHLLVRSGVLVSVHAPLAPTRRAGWASSPTWCWSPAARCCCSPCAGTGCVRGWNNAVVARVAAARQQRPADGRRLLVVLLGTLLPLVHKQLGLEQHFGGEPFFNTMFTWLMVPFALLLGWGRWCAGAGTGRVTSGRCCSPPWSPPWCCRTAMAAGR